MKRTFTHENADLCCVCSLFLTQSRLCWWSLWTKTCSITWHLTLPDGSSSTFCACWSSTVFPSRPPSWALCWTSCWRWQNSCCLLVMIQSEKKIKWQGFISKFLLLLLLLFLLLWSFPWQQLQCVTYGTREKRKKRKQKKKKKEKEEVTRSLYHKFNNNNNLYSSEIVLFSVNSVSFILHLN